MKLYCVMGDGGIKGIYSYPNFAAKHIELFKNDFGPDYTIEEVEVDQNVPGLKRDSWKFRIQLDISQKVPKMKVMCVDSLEKFHAANEHWMTDGEIAVWTGKARNQEHAKGRCWERYKRHRNETKFNLAP